MPYCTLDDIKKSVPEDILVQLTDDEALGAINEARVEEAVRQADATIDSYCGARYGVPFATAPAVIKALSADIAVYNLYSRKLDVIPDTRAERFKNAVRQLEGISKGIIALGTTPEPAGPPDKGPQASTSPSGRLFTKKTLKGY